MTTSKIFAVACSVLTAFAISGCLAINGKDEMVATDIPLLMRHDRSVTVRTSGGSPRYEFDISDSDFKSVIEHSIIQTKVFKSVVQGNNADYDLAVAIVNFDKPSFGLSHTAKLETVWELRKRTDKSVMMRKSIQSSGTATFEDYFEGSHLKRLAIERAARLNIEQALQAISALPL